MVKKKGPGQIGQILSDDDPVLDWDGASSTAASVHNRRQASNDCEFCAKVPSKCCERSMEVSGAELSYASETPYVPYVPQIDLPREARCQNPQSD